MSHQNKSPNPFPYECIEDAFADFWNKVSHGDPADRPVFRSAFFAGAASVMCLLGHASTQNQVGEKFQELNAECDEYCQRIRDQAQRQPEGQDGEPQE